MTEVFFVETRYDAPESERSTEQLSLMFLESGKSAMISLRMLSPFTGDSPTIGPVRAVVITGERMTLDGKEVAVHRNGQWHHAGRHYTTILLDSPIRLSFEDDFGNRSATYGPFDSLKLVDGAIRTGESFRDVISRLDESSKHWVVYDEPGEWLRAVFVSTRPGLPPDDERR